MPSRPERVCVALGGNMGDVAATLARAVRALDALPDTRVLAVSSLCRTPPVGGPAGQPAFLNGAALVETAMAPGAFMQRLLEIEKTLGRVREVPDGPRTVDLDILLWDSRVIDEPHLRVPHPRMRQRAFVLAPLAEIAPDALHPELGLTVAQLLADLGPLEAFERLPAPWTPSGASR